MRKLIVLPVIALLALPVFANTTQTTTTRSYESTDISPASSEIEAQEAPVMGSDLEAEENFEQENLDSEQLEQERMEESSEYSEDSIDYNDRTRTNRERKALNTGSDASDDE